jgi:hypothetical protein
MEFCTAKSVCRRASFVIDEVSYLKDHHVRIYIHPSGGGLRRRRQHPVQTLKVGLQQPLLLSTTTVLRSRGLRRLPTRTPGGN